MDVVSSMSSTRFLSSSRLDMEPHQSENGHAQSPESSTDDLKSSGEVPGTGTNKGDGQRTDTDSGSSIGEDKKPAAKRHNTRARNGIIKRADIYKPFEAQDDGSDDSLLDSCAIALASLDKRAFARAQLRDANSLLEELVLPMSFPWAHPNTPVFKTIPRDLDEMPGILSIDNVAVGTIGKLEHVRRSERLPKHTRMAAIRSDDPGVIQLTTYMRPSLAQRHLHHPSEPFNNTEEDPHVPGEISLRMYREVQARKRRRTDMESLNLKKTLVSFRLGSTSSRASVFDRVVDDETPLFLPALLHRRVQEGARLRGEEALQMRQELGSYNCRQGLGYSSTKPVDHSTHRVWVGRARLIWSEREGPGLRAPFRSILTGERLEANALKRPLLVKVAIRINGSVLSTKPQIAQKYTSALAGSLSGIQGASEAFSYSGRVVNEALDNSCGSPPVPFVDRSQCSLCPENFFSNILEDSKQKTSQVQPIRERFSLAYRNSSVHNGQTGQTRLVIVPPHLDCLFTEEAMSVVLCSKPGNITATSETRPNGCSDLESPVSKPDVVRSVALESGRCFRCWDTNTRRESSEYSVHCKDCMVSVHASCCTIEEQTSSQQWTCVPCRDQIKGNTSANCAICGLSGGEVTHHGDSWVHNLCRIYCNLAPNRIFRKAESQCEGKTVCHLCGFDSGYVLKCAAENCQVQFHPMCAIISSTAAKQHLRSKNHTPVDRDTLLCTQYTLSMLHTSYSAGGLSSHLEKTALPLGFCGYHHPDRKDDLRGLYPTGSYLDGAMRIPPKRLARRKIL